jgi:hypothetical protein
MAHIVSYNKKVYHVEAPTFAQQNSKKQIYIKSKAQFFNQNRTSKLITKDKYMSSQKSLAIPKLL